MNRYQLQHEIFILTTEIYPSLQHEEAYKHLEKVWTYTDSKLSKYLETLKYINGE